jgi:hypothetical protein
MLEQLVRLVRRVMLDQLALPDPRVMLAQQDRQEQLDHRERLAQLAQLDQWGQLAQPALKEKPEQQDQSEQPVLQVQKVQLERLVPPDRQEQLDLKEILVASLLITRLIATLPKLTLVLEN